MVALCTVIASCKEVDHHHLLEEHATVGSKQFSGVKNGEKFIFKLELDPQLYEQPSVSVTMECNEKTGLSVCQAPGCCTCPWESGTHMQQTAMQTMSAYHSLQNYYAIEGCGCGLNIFWLDSLIGT